MSIARSYPARTAAALFANFTQTSRILKLHTPLGSNVLLAESLFGEEGIDTAYCLQLSALSTDSSLSLRSLLGQPALLELQADSRETRRPFHGYITTAQVCGANGGLARYRLTVEPWTAFLRLGRDSRIFQNKSVIDIIDAVFAASISNGKIAIAWRIQVDRSRYPIRSVTTQYQESDMAFVERLMSEEGLFSYFEHDGNPYAPALGGHTMVIGDSNDMFVQNAHAAVRFTRSAATMTEDGIDRWRSEIRVVADGVDLRSWDYRTRSVRAVSTSSGNGPRLLCADTPGPYAYPTREHGEQIAERQLQALEAKTSVHHGAGCARTFSPGTTFTLRGHSTHDGDEFLLVHVRHLAHNNLSAEIGPEIQEGLGADPIAALGNTELASSLHAPAKRISERPVYRNSFKAIRSNVRYRGNPVDGNGRLLHPRPTIRGQQTAIVVGPAGAPIHTDRDHRIKIQFHWQRGSASHSRLEHPAPQGHVGAPGDDTTGTWVRVATPFAPVAGANWGGNALPRVGQEVLVDFLDGDIDRPVVIGTLYNGKGASDAPYNQFAQGAAAATGNAPVWFPGEAGTQAHPAVLSGIKSQSMQDSATGNGAYSQLVFDDSPDQARTSLQRHAKAHEGTEELNLGYLRHQADNQRLAPLGFGAELKALNSVALRAGRGLLLVTDAASASAGMLDSEPAAGQVEETRTLQESLARAAQQHNARLPDESAPEKLRPVTELAHTVEVLRATNNSDSGNRGVTAYSDSHLQLSTPAGIAALTPASVLMYAGTTTSIGAGQDIGMISQAASCQSVKDGISLFTYGKATDADKPNQETGIRMHAASGKVSSQSQADATRLTADKTVTVASVMKSVNIKAKEHVLLTAQGASIRLTGGNIELHAPGKVSFKASVKELAGPKSNSLVLPSLPKSQAVLDDPARALFSQQIVSPDSDEVAPQFAGVPYEIWKRGKPVQIASGMLDETGKSARLFTESAEDLTVIVGDASWEITFPTDNGFSEKGDLDD
jgi:type VI secretion system VgrG family protein